MKTSHHVNNLHHSDRKSRNTKVWLLQQPAITNHATTTAFPTSPPLSQSTRFTANAPQQLNQLLFVILHSLEMCLKPNSHQTIFLTDFQRQTKIEKSVVVGRFFKKNRQVGHENRWGRHQRFLFLKNRPIFSPISPTILPSTIIKHV